MLGERSAPELHPGRRGHFLRLKELPRNPDFRWSVPTVAGWLVRNAVCTAGDVRFRN